MSTDLDLGLLRVATAGSVDDGKSTLIGRLLLDSKAIFEDQLEAVEATSQSKGYDYTDLALLTDGLRSEREQGITIDVAYRYFATPTRKFIIADTPGHVQYTRNMVTGASTAQLAVVLVDARHGVVEQTRRHVAVAAMLKVPHVVLAVNMMDLVGYQESVFAPIADEFAAYARALGVPEVTAIPISALHGDNVVARSARIGWYTGPSILEHLEHLELDDHRSAPVQGLRDVLRRLAPDGAAQEQRLPVLPLVRVLVEGAGRRRDGEVRDGCPAGGEAQLGVGGEVADHGDDGVACHGSSPCPPERKWCGCGCVRSAAHRAGKDVRWSSCGGGTSGSTAVPVCWSCWC